MAEAGIRAQTTGAGEATVEGAPRQTVPGTAGQQQPTPAGDRGTPGTSQLRPARQLQFLPAAQGPDVTVAGVTRLVYVLRP